MRHWGGFNVATVVVFLGTLALPVCSVAVVALAAGAERQRAGGWLVAYAWLVALAGVIISIYLAYWRVLGIRLWIY
jgi:hypothetical protein